MSFCFSVFLSICLSDCPSHVRDGYHLALEDSGITTSGDYKGSFLWRWDFYGKCVSVCLSFCLSIFLFFCLSVFLSFCLSVFLSFCLSVFLSFCLSVFLTAHLMLETDIILHSRILALQLPEITKDLSYGGENLIVSVCLFIYLPVFLSFYFSVFLFFCLSVFLSFCLSVYLSICLSDCPSQHWRRASSCTLGFWR
jgi:hypothetical protein